MLYCPRKRHAGFSGGVGKSSGGWEGNGGTDRVDVRSSGSKKKRGGAGEDVSSVCV